MAYVLSENLIPGRPDTTLDKRAVVDHVTDIPSIELPHVGMLVYAKDTGMFYVIRTLAPKTIGGFTVNNAAVGTYEPLSQDPHWYGAS